MAQKKQELEIQRGEVLIYQASKGDVRFEVHIEKETAWLSLNQIALLFDTDKSGISRHLKNIYDSGELSQKATVANFATVQKEGRRSIERKIEFYNLDAIISVGYRVNSKQATKFRVWATKTLKKHLLQGYTVNEKLLLKQTEKFRELQGTIEFLRNKSEKILPEGQGREILRLLSDYATTLSLLEKYDKKTLAVPRGKKPGFVLSYEDCLNVISELKKNLVLKKEASDIFGNEKDNTFEGIVRNLYQTFDKKQLYPTIEEKAANLLYLIIKDHPFSDGNKRTGAFLFVYFLDKNDYLYRENGERKINDNALTTLALLIAESNPKEKDTMVKMVMNLLSIA